MKIKERFNIMCNPTYMEILQAYSKRRCLSRSMILEEAIEEYIKNHNLGLGREPEQIRGQVRLYE